MRKMLVLILLVGCQQELPEDAIMLDSPEPTDDAQPGDPVTADNDPPPPPPPPCVPAPITSPCLTKCGDQSVRDSCGVEIRYACDPCECLEASGCSMYPYAECISGYCIKCGRKDLDCCPNPGAMPAWDGCDSINMCDPRTSKCEPCGTVGLECCEGMGGVAYRSKCRIDIGSGSTYLPKCVGGVCE